MSKRDIARRTDADVCFDGEDISKDMREYLLSITYSDNEDADDLQITLHDRDNIWLCHWLNNIIDAAALSGASVEQKVSSGNASGSWAIGDAVSATGTPQYSSYGEGPPGTPVTNYNGNVTYLNLKGGIPYPIHVGYLGWFAINQVTKSDAAPSPNNEASSKGLYIQAAFVRENWKGNGESRMLDCGQFEMDYIDVSGPPAIITIKGTSLSYRSQVRQTKKNRAWEATSLSKIANEIASQGGMDCMYEAKINPAYKRVEQSSQSDISFLAELCKDAGLSLKVVNNMLVLFDQAEYEAKPTIMTIKRGDKSYIKYKLRTSTSDTQYASCRVSYVDPSTGKAIEATAYAESYDVKNKNNQQLEVTAKVSSIGEAKVLASKRLRLHNKYEKIASFTMPGNPSLMVGRTIRISSWGAWSGKYIIVRAQHTLGSSGYVTQIDVRHVLEGY